jgi:predicted helicase
VVRFIIRGIDELLKREFGIAKGLADNEKITVTKSHIVEKGKTIKDTHEIHRVQMLDVAVGTGTFLNETVNHIHESQKANQGRWNAYVEDDLLPRLHGFELMMASYTIAHLKLAMTLKKSGVQKFGKRLGVYLSNTLDDAHDIPLTSSLFGVVDSIAQESRLASEVKNDTPIMVVMGNPPYSGESQNPHYTGNDVYKVEPGGTEKLKERNSKWLNDDYVKFIRFAENLVEKNGEGVVGMITAHGYIDNPTFRGMRWKLRDTFDVIYVLDLHGNSNKKETAPDGSEDKNVFDIKTGVSIIFGVRKKSVNSNKKPLATIYQADIYGKRALKFEKLNNATIENIHWSELPKDNDIWKVEGKGKSEYVKGFSVSDLFLESSAGIVTSRDGFIIADDKRELQNRIEDFLNLEPQIAKSKYNLSENKKWKIKDAQRHDFDSSLIFPISYRPFDKKFIYYHNDFIERSREKVMKHLLSGNNIALVTNRQVKAGDTWQHVLVSNAITESTYTSNKTSEIGSVFPLYTFDDNGVKTPNLSSEIILDIESICGQTTPDKIFDYVYAYLHSPKYRKNYVEFLKIDFPRVPYPVNQKQFENLSALGKNLRELHLSFGPAVGQSVTSFPEVGNDVVEKVVYKNGKVYINETQYWDGISSDVWNYYIGCYQPAQKYLKDRKDKKLTTAEFENYEMMITSIAKTIEVMKEISKVTA